MISAIAWVPKGASKPDPEVVELPSKDEIEEMIKSGALDRRYSLALLLKINSTSFDSIIITIIIIQFGYFLFVLQHKNEEQKG